MMIASLKSRFYSLYNKNHDGDDGEVFNHPFIAQTPNNNT